jgi:hypothetical protein
LRPQRLVTLSIEADFVNGLLAATAWSVGQRPAQVDSGQLPIPGASAGHAGHSERATTKV